MKMQTDEISASVETNPESFPKRKHTANSSIADLLELGKITFLLLFPNITENDGDLLKPLLIYLKYSF